MLARKDFNKLLWLSVIVAASVILFGCSKPPEAKPVAEQEPVPPPTETVSQHPQPTQNPELPPPTTEDVKKAVERIFKSAVVIDQDRSPGFLVGDFNGDLSQDLAAIVKPVPGKVSELNQEFPNWIAREPVKDLLLPKSRVLTVAARSSTNAASGQTIRFEQSDVLMAIIHGNGPKGWHDPDATQTHLLRDVVGTNLRTLPLKDAVKAYSRIKPFPTIHGDLIQQTLIGQSGFLHFSGGIYGWYDPKNYSPAPVAVHSRMSGMK